MPNMIIADYLGEQVEVLDAFQNPPFRLAVVKLPRWVTQYTHGGPIETNVITVRGDLLKDVRTVEITEEEGD